MTQWHKHGGRWRVSGLSRLSVVTGHCWCSHAELNALDATRYLVVFVIIIVDIAI
jgi:hypothetical protein